MADPVQGVPFSLHYLVGEAASVATIVGAIAQVLPSVATVMAIVWYGILIAENRTMRRMRAARQQVEEDALAAKLQLAADAEQAKASIIEAAHEAVDKLHPPIG